MPITLPSYVAPNELIQSAWGNAVVDALDELDDEKLDLTGGTVTGQIVLGAGSPIANGDATRKFYVDNLIPVSAGESGPDNAGPTSGATVLTVNTFSLPTPALAGRVHAWGQACFTQTVSTDIFELTMVLDGTVVGATRTDNVPAGTNHTLSVTGHVSVGTSGVVPVTMRIARISGTGTATIGTTSPSSTLHAILIKGV